MFKKKFVKVALILMALGAVFMLGSLPFGGHGAQSIVWNNGFRPVNILKFDETVAPFNELSVSVRNMSVEIVTGSEFRVEATYPDDMDLDIFVEEGVLTVVDTSRRRHGFFNIGFSLEAAKLVITVPEGTLEGGVVNTSNASIRATNVTGRELTMQTSNGPIRLTDSNLQSVSLISSNGRIEVVDVNANNIITQTSNGPVNIVKLQAEESLIKSSNGGFNIEASELGNATLQTSNGTVRVADTSFSAGSTVTNSNGRIEIINPNEIRFEGTTSNSSVDIAQAFTQGEEIVTLRTSNGRITVE